MRKNLWIIMAALPAIAIVPITGCSAGAPGGGGDGGDGGQVQADFELQGDTAVFEVQAGVPTEKRISGTFTLSGFSAGSGALAIDPAAILVAPAGPQKSSVALATQTVVVTGWVRSADQVTADCNVGDEYGPYTVVFDDETFVVSSVDPPSITLTQNTIDLINGGEFSICIRVESTVDLTIEISKLTFNLST